MVIVKNFVAYLRKRGAVSTHILHFLARVLAVYGEGLFMRGR